jgi:hypothetical protein
LRKDSRKRRHFTFRRIFEREREREKGNRGGDKREEREKNNTIN